MKPEEKNYLYNNILEILKTESLSVQDKAKEITLYIENILNAKESELAEQEELYGGEGRPNLPLPKFGKMFKRIP